MNSKTSKKRAEKKRQLFAKIKKEEWVEDFDKEVYSEGFLCKTGDNKIVPDYSAIKQFITTLLQKERERVLGEIEKMKYPETEKTKDSIKYPTADPTNPHEAIEQFIHNQTLEKLKKEL